VFDFFEPSDAVGDDERRARGARALPERLPRIEKLSVIAQELGLLVQGEAFGARRTGLLRQHHG